MQKFLTKLTTFVVVSTLAAVLISTVLYTIQPHFPFLWYETVVVNNKILHVREHGHTYTTLFFGSSLTERHIDPQIYNDATGEVSFNAGIRSMRSFRLLQWVDEVLAQTPNVETVFIQLYEPIPAIQDDNSQTNPILGSTHWYQVPIELDYIAAQKSGKEKEKALWYTTKKFIRKYSGVGISERILLLLGLYDKQNPRIILSDTEREELITQQGLHIKENEQIENQEIFFDKLERGIPIMEGRADLYHQVAPDTIVFDAHMSHASDFAQQLQEKGITVIFFIPPRSQSLVYFMQFGAYLRQQGYIVLDMANPETFPEFYFDDAYHYDGTHMNHAGARHFTEKLIETYRQVDVPQQK